MDSKIFVVATEKMIEVEQVDSTMTLDKVIIHCRPFSGDYVEFSDLEEDVKNLFVKHFCNIEKTTFNDKYVYKVDTKSFLDSVSNHKSKVLESIKNEVEKNNPDLNTILQATFPKNTELFIIDEDGLHNEFELDRLKDNKYFLILSSYNYHTNG